MVAAVAVNFNLVYLLNLTPLPKPPNVHRQRKLTKTFGMLREWRMSHNLLNMYNLNSRSLHTHIGYSLFTSFLFRVFYLSCFRDLKANFSK